MLLVRRCAAIVHVVDTNADAALTLTCIAQQIFAIGDRRCLHGGGWVDPTVHRLLCCAVVFLLFGRAFSVGEYSLLSYVASRILRLSLGLCLLCGSTVVSLLWTWREVFFGNAESNRVLELRRTLQANIYLVLFVKAVLHMQQLAIEQ